jgi:hypothetical protein
MRQPSALRIAKLSVIASAALLAAMQGAEAQRVHYLGIAGPGSEPVFRTEVSGAARMVGAVWPLASSRSVGGLRRGGGYRTIRASIRHAAGRMDRERDILFLVVSSHGETHGGGVELSDGGAMTPGMLRKALDEAGVRNRIVVVSACFSGQFVGPLSGPNSVVITAASTRGFAYGCPTRCDYTDFGDAFFRRGLARAGGDLRGAFDIARTVVADVARSHGLTPPRPQMSMGGEIAKRLAYAK